MATVETHTDCRAVAGVAVGLLDGMIAQVRVLRWLLENTGLLDEEAVQAVLQDAAQDEDINWLCAAAVGAQGGSG